MVVRGEAGIGKTALINTAVGEVRGAGLNVCRGAAQIMDAHRPFGVLLVLPASAA